MLHFLKKKVLSSFELRECLSLAFRKYIAVSIVTARGESFKATYRRIDLNYSIEERFELMRNKKNTNLQNAKI